MKEEWWVFKALIKLMDCKECFISVLSAIAGAYLYIVSFKPKSWFTEFLAGFVASMFLSPFITSILVPAFLSFIGFQLQIEKLVEFAYVTNFIVAFAAMKVLPLGIVLLKKKYGNKENGNNINNF